MEKIFLAQIFLGQNFYTICLYQIFFVIDSLGNKIKQVGCCMGNFNWFHSIKGHRYLNENPFCPIRSSFPAILGFCGDFWQFLKNFQKFFHSICDFYCTQHDRLDLTVSTQKSVWKTNHPGPRYLQKYFLIGHAKPNRQPILVFLKYLGLG